MGTDGFVESLYRISLELVEEAKAFGEDRMKRDVAEFGPHHSTKLVVEYLRVTTRLIECVSWLAAQKAAASGEIDATRAAGAEYSPVDYGTDRGAELAPVPAAFPSLRDRAFALHDRILRLSRLAATAYAA